MQVKLIKIFRQETYSYINDDYEYSSLFQEDGDWTEMNQDEFKELKRKVDLFRKHSARLEADYDIVIAAKEEKNDIYIMFEKAEELDRQEQVKREKAAKAYQLKKLKDGDKKKKAQMDQYLLLKKELDIHD